MSVFKLTYQYKDINKYKDKLLNPFTKCIDCGENTNLECSSDVEVRIFLYRTEPNKVIYKNIIDTVAL